MSHGQRSILLSLSLLAACDDGGGKHDYKDSCAVDCDRLHQCSSSVDVESCASTCEQNLADIGPHLRSDYLAGIDACIAEASCAELVISSLTDACPDEAKAKLAPSKTANALCEAVADSLQMCLGLSVGTSGCLETVKIFDDHSLSSGLRCADSPCDQRAQCLVEALGVNLLGG